MYFSPKNHVLDNLMIKNTKYSLTIIKVMSGNYTMLIAYTHICIYIYMKPFSQRGTQMCDGEDCGSWTHDLGHTNGVLDMKVATHTSRLGTEGNQICDTKGFFCVKTHKCLVCGVCGHTN